MQEYISPALGAIFGMFILEGHTICKAGWYTFKKYHNDPQIYGLNQWTVMNCHHRPVLLLHGAVGSWSYLGDFAVALRDANIPVFVMNLDSGLPTEDVRKKIFNKIKEIRKLYYSFNHKSNDESHSTQCERQSMSTTPDETSIVTLRRTSDGGETSKSLTNSTSSPIIPPVDIVAHSNGGNIALYSAFTGDSSYIDRHGNLKFRCTPESNPHVGKVITVALPSNQTETDWMRQINKLDDLFNINAKFDALMAYKKCALVNELPSHVHYIDAGHIGIVFKHSTYNQVLQFLLK